MILNVKALLRSAVCVVWLVVGMTLVSEMSAPFKAFLAGLAGHHWVAKSIISAAAFVVFYFLLRKSDEQKGILGSAIVLAGSVVLGGLVIFGYFASALWGLA